jgi:hypothetical protein
MLAPGWPDPEERRMPERRITSRQKSFLRGRLFFNKGRSAVDCLIRDISESGARLIFSTTVSVPDIVDLYIPQKEQTMRVHVQWRHGDDVGVAFPPAQPASEAAAAMESGDFAERMQKLEADVAALRRVVKRLQAAVPAADADVA